MMSRAVDSGAIFLVGVGVGVLTTLLLGMIALQYVMP